MCIFRGDVGEVSDEDCFGVLPPTGIHERHENTFYFRTYLVLDFFDLYVPGTRELLYTIRTHIFEPGGHSTVHVFLLARSE